VATCVGGLRDVCSALAGHEPGLQSLGECRHLPSSPVPVCLARDFGGRQYAGSGLPTGNHGSAAGGNDTDQRGMGQGWPGGERP